MCDCKTCEYKKQDNYCIKHKQKIIYISDCLYYTKTSKRYQIINKYNPNELIQDNYYKIDNTPQLYDAECVEYELNDYHKRLKKIYKLCQETKKTKTITEIMKIIEGSTDTLNEYKIYE